jgi:hypothetical protein
MLKFLIESHYKSDGANVQPNLFIILTAVFAMSVIGLVPYGRAGVPPPPHGPPVDNPNWQVYRNDPYRFELRYPPGYAIMPPGDQPQPAPLLRIWFQETGLLGSPIASLQPPPFAIDVYDNPLRQSLDAWLASSGVVRTIKRFTSKPIDVGGVVGVRLTDQALIAPNVFCYVARGPFVYRFTLLGTHSNQMLSTVKFTE